MAIDVLLQEAQGMTEETLMEVVRFMQFLKSEALRNTSGSSEIAHTEKQKKRHAGLYKGQIVMADDFDAALDDFEGYM